MDIDMVAREPESTVSRCDVDSEQPSGATTSERRHDQTTFRHPIEEDAARRSVHDLGLGVIDLHLFK